MHPIKVHALTLCSTLLLSGAVCALEAELYPDVNFGGTPDVVTQGKRTGILLNDQVSSVKVPQGTMLTLYDDENFGGKFIHISYNDEWLGPDAFNDRVGSYQLEPLPATHAIVYARAGFSAAGPRMTVAHDIPDLERYEIDGEFYGAWEDSLQGVKLAGNTKVTLYEEKNYQGPLVEITEDTMDVTSIGWFRRASSLKIESTGGGGGGGGGEECITHNAEMHARFDGLDATVLAVESAISSVSSSTVSIENAISTASSDIQGAISTHDSDIHSAFSTHDSAIQSALSTHDSAINTHLALHDADIKDDVATHDADIKADVAIHDADIKADVAQHDAEIKADVAQHDVDIKADIDTRATAIDKVLKLDMAQQEVDVQVLWIKDDQLLLMATEAGLPITATLTSVLGVDINTRPFQLRDATPYVSTIELATGVLQIDIDLKAPTPNLKAGAWLLYYEYTEVDPQFGAHTNYGSRLVGRH